MSDVAPLTIPKDEAYFAGHFPGNPLVPGVVVLQYVVEEIERRVGTGQVPHQIPAVKFLAPLRPGDRMTIELEFTGAASVRFTCRAGDRPIAAGLMTMRPRTFQTGNG